MAMDSLNNSLNLELTTPTFIAQQNKTAIKRSSSNKGGLIGGVVGGIITVVLVILLLLWIYRKRRNKIPKLQKLPTNSSNTNHATNMQYGLVCTIPTVDEYAIVNKGNAMNKRSMPEHTTIQKDHAFSAPEDTYVAADEDEYDKLNNVMIRKIHNDGNLYDITGQCGKDEYDTMKGVLDSNVNKTYDLYDTNVYISNENSDQTYDISNIEKFKETRSNDAYDYVK